MPKSCLLMFLTVTMSKNEKIWYQWELSFVYLVYYFCRYVSKSANKFTTIQVCHI